MSTTASLPGGLASAQTAPAEPAPLDGRRVRRVAAALSLLGLAALGAWAAMAPLDEGVPAAGHVVVDTKRKPVQHPTGGIIRQVFVGEGSVVQAGQPLFELDAAQVRAEREAVRQRYLGLRAMEARLQAERDGTAAMTPHPDLQAALDDPQIRAQWQTQEQLLASRRAALQAELAGLDETARGQQAALESYRSVLGSRQTQLGLLEDELGHIRGLVAEGYAPRNRQLELERQAAELRGTLADLQGNIARAGRTLAELAQRGRLRTEEHRKDGATQLASIYLELQSGADRLRALDEELGRTRVLAPTTGQVVGLGVQAPGAVVQPAQKLADVVPEGEPLLLEVQVPPHVIDRVRAGLPVDVRFSGFAQTPQLVVAGEVRTVSADALLDPVTQQSHYLARVALTAEGRRALGTRQLQPGMPVEVVFRTGERSFASYMLHPLVRRMAASMKEE
ncbi:MAG: hypothetical protein RL456_2009 [Pseudomonadota bacterium]|jgi:protease secretion system membrane fusion protein